MVLQIDKLSLFKHLIVDFLNYNNDNEMIVKLLLSYIDGMLSNDKLNIYSEMV